jgi:hypothetical protein
MRYAHDDSHDLAHALHYHGFEHICTLPDGALLVIRQQPQLLIPPAGHDVVECRRLELSFILIDQHIATALDVHGDSALRALGLVPDLSENSFDFLKIWRQAVAVG